MSSGYTARLDQLSELRIIILVLQGLSLPSKCISCSFCRLDRLLIRYFVLILQSYPLYMNPDNKLTNKLRYLSDSSLQMMSVPFLTLPLDLGG
jgi:hypothetical protein